MENIVVIGGGTGLFTILKGLKKHRVELSAVVTMMDDGGSSGVLRDEFGTLPPGDIRRCLVALSDSTEMMKDLLQYRFDRGKGLKGHTFGNLLLTALKDITGSDENAIKEAARILNIRGDVIPVTHDSVLLYAKLDNGRQVKGESAIPGKVQETSTRIKKVYLKPKAHISRDARKALMFADLIILGPGDLYTSIIPNLLVDGVADTIRSSDARKVYVCNLATKHGETDGYKLSDFVQAINRYLGNDTLDYVIYNNGRPTRDIIRKYAKEKSYFVRADVKKTREITKAQMIGDNLVSQTDIARHNPDSLAELVLSLMYR